MKKSFYGIITIMLLLAMMLPLSVNAATLSVDKTEMNVGDIVTVEVTTRHEVESIQFDLQFDSNKYEYVNDSAKSELDSTDSNLIANNIVRVSAFDMESEKADTVTMKFKAIASGTSVPFNVVGTVEIGENGENFDAVEVEVKQINGVDTKVSNSTQYVDGNGKVITRLPQTGGKKPIRIYGELVQGENIVAYALPYSDTTLSISDIKADFGSQITVNDVDSNGILGTGETFTLNGINYTVIIYGDVNGDGKVTTADALRTRKAEIGSITVDVLKQEALDVIKVDENDNGEHTANALAQQVFILRKQYGTMEETILDKYPEEAGNLIQGISGNEEIADRKYRYEDIDVASLSSAIGSDVITRDILTYELKLNGEIVNPNSKTAEVIFTEGNTGNFSMTLYAAQAGKYEVTPIIVGTNVEGGVQKGETYEIDVAENREATSIVVKEGENAVAGNVQVRIGKSKELNVELIHEYTNVKPGYTEPEPFVITDIEDNQVKITYGNNDASYFESTTAFTNNVLTIDAIKTGTTTLTVGAGSATKTINLNILPEAKVAGIVLNETKLTDTATTMSPINLYMDQNYVESDKTEKKVEDSFGNTIICTMLPIKLIDEDEDTSRIQIKDIDNIYEAGDPDFGMEFKIGYYALNDQNEYEEKYSPDDRIDAIGIAIESNLESGWFEKVKAGVAIEYATVNENKSATIPVKVFKNGVELTEEPEENTTKLDNVSGTTQVTTPTVQTPVTNSPVTTPSVSAGAEIENNTNSNSSFEDSEETEEVEKEEEEEISEDQQETEGVEEEDSNTNNVVNNPGNPTRPLPSLDD